MLYISFYLFKKQNKPQRFLEQRKHVVFLFCFVFVCVQGKKPSATGEVHIWVKECIDLPILRGTKLNSFVKW